MKTNKSEFNELDKNAHGEEVAIAGYIQFEAHLMTKGRYADANKIREIKNEEKVHLRELHEMKKRWKSIK